MSTEGANRTGFRRHLEGWQAGALAVGIAAVGAALAIPWKVEPRDVPLPFADERALKRTLEGDRDRAREIAPELERELSLGTGGPMFDLRAFGEALRAYGHVEAKHDPAELVSARRKL